MTIGKFTAPPLDAPRAPSRSRAWFPASALMIDRPWSAALPGHREAIHVVSSINFYARTIAQITTGREGAAATGNESVRDFDENPEFGVRRAEPSGAILR